MLIKRVKDGAGRWDLQLLKKYPEEQGDSTQTDYIYTPAGLTAMMKGGVLYYLHTENLGSIQAITDESKTVISSYYYTPWGGRVLLSGVNITDRGYTFHEHLEAFCLINMNGRVYDPMLARFLSPDPYVQMPDYTQNFNRYSYCLNNPFKYTDPSGESIIAIIGGAIIGGIGYTASVAFSDYGLCAWSSNDCIKSMVVGAISGAVTCGIGSAFGTTGSIVQGTFDLGNELARAGAHAVANGFISLATGNEFLPGFVAGGMGSFGGSLFQGMAGGIMQAHPILEAIGTVSSSTLSGGIGAELTGGDFWRGAATGAIVGLLNHCEKYTIKQIELNKLLKKYKEYGDLSLLYSMVGTGLVESTTSGELLTNIREAINSVNVPGRDDNRAHEMYSNAVDILKALNPEGKFNYGYSVMSMGCYAEAMKMNVWMRYYATKIRIIDANYYNHEILHKYFGGMSGGGGAASSL